MERGVGYVIIGLCFIASLLGLIVFIFWFSNFNVFGDDTIVYRGYTNQALNIKVNGLVKHKGISVGRISDIKFRDDNFNEIEIIVNIDKRLPIRKNSFLVVEQSGLIGDSYLSLVQNEKSKEIIKSKEDAILNIKGHYMSKLLGDIPNITGKIDNLINNASDIVSEDNVKNILSIIASIRTITNNVNAMVSVLEKNTNNVDSILNNINTLANNANNILDSINQKVKNGEYDFKSTLAPALNSLEDSINNMNKLIKSSGIAIDSLNSDPYNTIFGYREE